MLPAATLLRRTVLAVCLVLVLAGAWTLGRRMETSTQVRSPRPIPSTIPSTIQSPVQFQSAAPVVSVAQNEPGPSSLPSLPSLAAALNAPDLSPLRSRALVLPVQGATAAQLSDTYTQARAGGAAHEALDIMAPRGTPVLAVEEGRVAKLFLSKSGGITLYQFDPDRHYAYYYAHLDSYADGVAEGANLRKGQVIGYVGSTGNASPDAPHLHFAIFRLGPERQWWRGTPLNPYLVWRDARP